MPATVHIIRHALGVDPTPALLAARGDATLWLTATARRADEVRRLLAAGVAFAPNVFELQAFADELVRTQDSAARPLDEASRRLLLDAAAGDGERTRGYSDAAAGLVAELKQVGAEPAAVAKALGAKRAADLFARYEKARRKTHRLDPADRLARAAELWAAGRREPFAAIRTVIVDGFTSLSEAQRRLLHTFTDLVSDIWLTLLDEPGAERAELFAPSRTMRGIIEQFADSSGLFAGEPQEIVAPAAAAPGGLQHLARTLFLPRHRFAPSANAEGVQLLEAPGTVGEARLVARAVRQLLAQNIPPRSIVVTARHPERTRAVFREVFDEHGIPCEWAGSEPLARHPGVAFLLRAWRLPEEDFPFAAVAALLRSTWFNPDWAEAELPLRAEALLRVVGEPRGREAFLAAVRGWCDAPPVALEDEQAEEPRRRRVQRLARQCRPFLERFFRLWDRLPRTGRAVAFVGWLAGFASDIGLTPDADAGWQRFWDELHRWATSSKGRLTRAQFGHALTTLASHVPLPPAAPRCDAVRILPPDDARLIECDYLFLTGLGEGSFPDAAAPDSLLTDADRERLRAAGVALPDPAARLSEEMLLFAHLACRPRSRLVLSYPAVDERGESLLPSSFLTAVRECFAPDAIPVARRKMLIEGYATEESASPAELRVRVARELAHADDAAVSDNALTPDLFNNLRAARDVARHRFRDRDFGPFDGSLRHPAIARDLAERFGPAKVFSPTALEAYVACPFRFWLEHVLRLEPLDDPGEEVEHTRRGAAVHRALARLHAALRESAVPLHQPELPELLGADFTARIEQAVEEYVARAPSAASRELWRLEARRLRRAADKYRRHWQTFRDPWHKPGAVPVPHSFEADFGLPAEDGRDPAPPLVIDVNGVEVRIGGRIDRVDVAELADGVGFWVIDYKTGRGQNYTPGDIAAFRKLQLPLYAVAVERVLLKDRPARPLGLAYWLVTDAGAKGVLPAGAKQVLSWLTDADRWPKFRAQLEAWVATLATHVRAGDFPLAPRSEHCTDTCPFGPVCRISQSRNTGKLFPLPLPAVSAEPRSAVVE